MRRSLALCLMTVVLSAANAFAIGEARLTGKVLDAQTKQPIADAVVRVEATEGRTFKQDFKGKKDGAYAIFLLDGTLRYKFTYSAPGYASYEETMKLKIGEPNTKDVLLNKAGSGASSQPAAAAAGEAKGDPAIEAYNAGAALANAGDVTGAIAKFEEAISKKADLLAAYQAVAKLYVRNKQYDKAVEAANKVLQIDDEDVSMWTVLFNSYTATGDKAKAAEAKKKLPANPSSLFNDAARAINAGKDAEAAELLKQAIAADDKFAKAYYELGMVYVRTGNNAGARENLSKYLELEPNGKDAATAKEMLNYVK